MTLEHESYFASIMASKGRSASICAPIAMHGNIINSGGEIRRDSPQEIGQTSRESFKVVSTSSPTKQQKKNSAAHRSQSARVVGSGRPKIKKRERDLSEYQKHLDLASSEGALLTTSESGCQDSYNPFLRKVPSTGKLITGTSLEMSNHSLTHGTPPQSQVPHQPTPPLQGGGTPRGSPKGNRKLSERRGSDQRSIISEKEFIKKHPGGIPIITTPEGSPILSTRRASHKPMGLPKSPQVSRSNTVRGSISGGSSSSAANNSQGGKGQHSKQQQQQVPTLLDVPGDSGAPDDEDEESYRLRSFSVTPKGIVNRGDSFRRRRSRSNSLIPSPATTPEVPRNETYVSEDGLLLPNSIQSYSQGQRSPLPSPKSPRVSLPHNLLRHTGIEQEPLTNHRVAMVGARGVGKAALVSQFMTSECINAYDRQNDVEGEETVSVMLNGEESEITFFKMSNPKTELNRQDSPDGFLLVYSVVDRSSYQRIEAELRRLEEMDLIQGRGIIVVGNKIDLARSRAVSTQDGRCLAVSFRVKFIEVSVGINHNVDELLVGLLHQIRLKQAQTGVQDSWYKHRGIHRASVKARQMLSWLVGKEDAKFKNCENLHIL